MNNSQNGISKIYSSYIADITNKILTYSTTVVIKHNKQITNSNPTRIWQFKILTCQFLRVITTSTEPFTQHLRHLNIVENQDIIIDFNYYKQLQI